METTNIRVYKSTHEIIKAIAKERRQDLIVVLDEIIKEYANSKS